MRLRRGVLAAWEGDPASPVWSRALAGSLSPLGAVYGASMARRRRRYEDGKARAEKIAAPVVSVGNLTLGGTGKTPTVAWTLEKLLAGGRRPAVVSRGHGARPGDAMVVSDGEGGLTASPPAADEAAMLARRYPGLPVLTGARRARVARKAAEEFGADAVVLDDGFQHLSLSREMDLVLLRGDRPFGNGRVTPAGALREPASALARADAVLVTGECSARARSGIQSLARGAPVFGGRLSPDSVLDARGEKAGSPDALQGARVVAVSGLGNPRGFEKTLESLGVEVLAHHAYADHARYAPADGALLASSLREASADFILTTEKDAVKLAPLLGGTPLRVLRVVMRIDEDAALAALIEQKLFSP